MYTPIHGNGDSGQKTLMASKYLSTCGLGTPKQPAPSKYVSWSELVQYVPAVHNRRNYHCPFHNHHSHLQLQANGQSYLLLQNMSAQVPSFQLNDGTKIPAVGMG